MKFLNPWIDPRVVQVRPAAAEAYLRQRGWKPLGPAANPRFTLFGSPEERDDAPTVLVPLQVNTVAGSDVQRLIDLVAVVALYEGRWAVDVLNDILQTRVEDGAAPNGAAAPQSAAAPK